MQWTVYSSRKPYIRHVIRDIPPRCSILTCTFIINYFYFICSSALGEDVKEIGKNLAAKRDAKLVGAEERLTDDILFYEFDFALNDGTHQLLSLSVNKGKIWSLDANTTEKRWSKRKEMYKNVLGSFMPKLS